MTMSKKEDTKKEDTKTSAGFKKVFQDWGEETTLHGIKHATGPHIGVIKR